MRILFLFLIFFVYNSVTYANEDTLRSSYGVFGNFTLNAHIADFSRVPDCPNCSPGFRQGSGTGFTYGILYEHPIDEMYSIAARLSYYNLSGLLSVIEPTTIIVNGQPTGGEFEHTFDATLNSFGFEPMIRITPVENLYINAGFHIGALMTKNYSQKEQIIKPSNTGTFLDSNGNDSFNRTRNEFSGELGKAASVYFAPLLGVSYSLPLNKNKSLMAEPELFYVFGITDIVDDPSVKGWIVHSLRIGLALKYSPLPQKDKIRKRENIEKIDTVYRESETIAVKLFKKGIEKVEKETLEDDDFITDMSYLSRTDTVITPKLFLIEASISAVGLSPDLKEVAKPKFIIEEFSTARLQPLLNYVFFDSLSSEINTRYFGLNIAGTLGFSVDSLYDLDVINTYRHLLNITGKRMLDFPSAKITLTGCNDGAAENNIKGLALARANSVKDYLVNVWKISPDRITVKSRNLPDKASTPINDPEKAQENRRVEIISDNHEITKPVFANFRLHTTSLPGIRFKPEINAEAGLKNWEITITQDGKLLKQFKFDSDRLQNADWLIADDQKSIPILDKPLNYILTAVDNKNHSARSKTGTIEIEQITVQKKREKGLIDKQIDNYSLILFDFDKSDVSSANKEIINFIKSRLKSDSKVEITGYTDRTGEADYNKRLSERRASTVFNELKHSGSTFKGLGEDILIYDNDFPEGRFYCRTINIRVESEIK